MCNQYMPFILPPNSLLPIKPALKKILHQEAISDIPLLPEDLSTGSKKLCVRPKNESLTLKKEDI